MLPLLIGGCLLRATLQSEFTLSLHEILPPFGTQSAAKVRGIVRAGAIGGASFICPPIHHFHPHPIWKLKLMFQGLRGNEAGRKPQVPCCSFQGLVLIFHDNRSAKVLYLSPEK